MNNIGTIIASLRKENGLTQNQLAARARITQQTVSLVETGKRPLTVRAAIAIGKALGQKRSRMIDLVFWQEHQRQEE